MATRKSEASSGGAKPKKSARTAAAGNPADKATKTKSVTSSGKKTSAKTTARKVPGAKNSSQTKAGSARKSSSQNKYGPSVGDRVGEEIDAMKNGELYSGSGQKVTSRKQAIAIALSEKRREGAKVPLNPNQPAAKSTKTRQK